MLRLLQRSSAAASAVGQCGSQCGGQCSGPVQRVSAAGQVQWSRVVSIAVSDYSSWCSGRCSSQCSLLSCFPQPAHKHRAHHCTQLCTKHCAQPWGQHSVKKERLSFGPDPPSLVFSEATCIGHVELKSLSPILLATSLHIYGLSSGYLRLGPHLIVCMMHLTICMQTCFFVEAFPREFVERRILRSILEEYGNDHHRSI